MKYFTTTFLQFNLAVICGFLSVASLCTAEQTLPKGLMLNLDFQNITEGLIPSKTLYPLFVPIGELRTQPVNTRHTLILDEGQCLDIPHSSLLDPDGSSWVISVRVIALTDGLIISQYNDTSGYAIYLKDGVVHANILSDRTSVTLREQPNRGIGSILKKQVTIDLKINPNSALLVLNRNRVAYTPLQKPLAGKNHMIRIGEHAEIPVPLKRKPAATTTGFTGGINAVKILRQ